MITQYQGSKYYIVTYILLIFVFHISYKIWITQEEMVFLCVVIRPCSQTVFLCLSKHSTYWFWIYFFTSYIVCVCVCVYYCVFLKQHLVVLCIRTDCPQCSDELNLQIVVHTLHLSHFPLQWLNFVVVMVTAAHLSYTPNRFTSFHPVKHYHCDGSSEPSTCHKLLEMTLFLMNTLLKKLKILDPVFRKLALISVLIEQ